MIGEFRDRTDAGRRLGAALLERPWADVVVLGLPRGGVPVAAEVAAALEAPLDIIVVRKLGVPFQPEVAMGAIGEDGTQLLDEDFVARLHLNRAEVERVEERERRMLEERIARLRAGRRRVDLSGRTALIVDDGIATGATAAAASGVARRLGAARVVVAVPVAAPDSVARVTGSGADEVICLDEPYDFRAVGMYYQDFGQTPDAEVIELLSRARS